MNCSTLGFVSRLRLVPQNHHTDINIKELNLIWLTQLFRNRLIQTWKLNLLICLDNILVNVVEKYGVKHIRDKGLQ